MTLQHLLRNLKPSREVVKNLPSVSSGHYNLIWLGEYAMAVPGDGAIYIGGASTNPMVDNEDEALLNIALGNFYKISKSRAEKIKMSGEIIQFPLSAFSERPGRRNGHNIPCYFFEIDNGNPIPSNPHQAHIIERFWGQAMPKYGSTKFIFHNRRGSRVPWVSQVKLRLTPGISFPKGSLSDIMDEVDQRKRLVEREMTERGIEKSSPEYEELAIEINRKGIREPEPDRHHDDYEFRFEL